MSIQDKVLFKESDHSYTSEYTGDRYTSVTTKISEFKRKFDGAYWSLYKAIESFLTDTQGKPAWTSYKLSYITAGPKSEAYLFSLLDRDFMGSWKGQILQIRNEILEEWDNKREESCIKGTAFHKDREQEAYTIGEQTYPDSFITSITQSSYDDVDLSKLNDGYHAEIKIYHHGYKLAGQVDRCWIQTDPTSGLRYVHLDDWKTNKKITTRNPYPNGKMLGPVAHMDDCHTSHYWLQVSMYAWILEQWGYTIGNLRFTHCLPTHRVGYPTQYLKREVEDILNYNKSDYFNLI